MNELKYYSYEETVDILKNNEALVFIDNGADDLIIKYADLPDFIVFNAYNSELTDLAVHSFENYRPLLTTYGMFLDRCDPEVRADIIDRLVALQMGEEEYKEIKLVNDVVLEKAQVSLDESVINKNKEDRER